MMRLHFPVSSSHNFIACQTSAQDKEIVSYGQTVTIFFEIFRPASMPFHRKMLYLGK